MERLTERNREGIAFLRIPLNESRLLDVEYCYTGFVADRLAEYEDIGLSPEEVDILETQLEQAQDKVKELEQLRHYVNCLHHRKCILPEYCDSGCQNCYALITFKEDE